MDYLTLVAFLKGSISPEAFGSEIAAEVDACQRRIKSAEIGYIIVPHGPIQKVTRKDVRRLLDALSSRQISFLAANYTADCLVMSDDFEFADEVVAQAIAFIGDDSRIPTREEIEAVASELG